MKKFTFKQWIFAICVAAFVALALFATKNAGADPQYIQSGTVELKCLSAFGDRLITYTGNSSSITWYGDGTYVKVNLADRTMYIPQHKCEMTTYK